MLKHLLKGFVIGIASILPGVSGGTLLVSMGLYDRMIGCITHFFSDFKANMKFLLPIAIGAGAALLGLSFLIEPAFAHFPLPTNLLFIGLILGGVPSILEKLKNDKGKLRPKPGHLAVLLTFACIILGSALFAGTSAQAVTPGTALPDVLRLFGAGIIASATMVIPGVSGSMLLLMMGYYTPLIGGVNALLRTLGTLDFAGAWQQALLLLPFGFGVLMGVIVLAKLVELVFEKCPAYACWAILGLILSSPIAILLAAEIKAVTLPSLLAGAGTLCLGGWLAGRLGD